MPLPTSDLQLEMRALREAYQQFSALQHQQEHLKHQQRAPSRLKHQVSQTSHSSQTSGRPSVTGEEAAPPVEKDKVSSVQDSNGTADLKGLNLSPALIPQRSHLVGDAFLFKDDAQPLTSKPLNKSVDLASLDSSDTYASCQTHPCLSQGDLASADDLLDCNDDMLYDFDAAGARTGSIMDFLDYENTNKLYVNPLQKSDSDALKLQKKLSASSMGIRGNMSTGASPRSVSLVKKSASGGFGSPAGTCGVVGGKFSHDLLPMTLTKGPVVSNRPPRQKEEPVNLIEGLNGGQETTTNREEVASGVPKHRKTRFQQPTPGGANQSDQIRKPGELTAANLITVSQLAQDSPSPFPHFGGALSTSSGGSSSTITGSQVSVEPAVAAASLSTLAPSASVKVKSRRASFMPARSLASATKKINQHLFGGGNSSSNSSAGGTVLVLGAKDATKKSLSLSNESLDSDGTATALRLEAQKTLQQQSPRMDASSQQQQHRRSKSILKNKGERLPNKFSSTDPENERLLMDSAAAPDNGVGCDCEYSPQRTLIHAKSAASLSVTGSPAGAGGAVRPRPVFVHQRSTPDASPRGSSGAKFQSPRHTETELATIRQHRQQKLFKETTLQGGSFGER